MLKGLLAALLIFACFSLTGNAQERVLITDFGGNPNDGKNIVMAIRNALNSCATKESSVLVFPKGRYDFWPDFTAQQATIGFQIDKMKNITIDGGGSEFIFHGKMQIVNIKASTNITVKNFSVDWDHPFMSQGEYVAATDEYIELKIDPEVYVIENSVFYLVGEGWKSRPTGYFNLYDKDKRDILYKTNDGINKSVFLGKAEEIKRGVVRFYGKPTLKPESGAIQVLYAGTYILTGIEIAESKDIFLKDLTIYHALSNGVHGSRIENITMDNVSMAINEKKGRVFSIVADASHFTNCKGWIKIINCNHAGQGDDFINVHGSNVPITKILDENSVTVIRNGSALGVGDEVWFVNKTTSQRGEVRIVKSNEQMGGMPGMTGGRNSSSKITFTEPIPKTVEAGDCIENKTWNASVEIRGCHILKKNRARGILVTTPEKVIIEDNYFSTAGTAILIEGDMDYWFESGANNDVTIRNNIFENCLTSGCSTGKRGEWGEAIISITPSHRPENEKAEPYHKNIKIENNTFKTFDIPLVHARSVRGLAFNNNEIIKTTAYEPYAWQKSSFLLDGCREVSIMGNRIADGYSTRLIETEHMKKTDMKVDKNSKFTVSAIDKAVKPVYIDDFKTGK